MAAGRGHLLAAAIGAMLATAAVAASSASASIATCQPFLDDEPCLQPFPNNLFTKKANTPTGRRVKLPADAMPVNADGVPVSPAEWNRNDGFSPGSMITVKVPGLDAPEALANTKPAPLANLKQYKRPGAPVIVIDQKTGKRHPIWVELDSNADSAESTNLLIHPAVNFKLRHRYIVVLRNLEDMNGARIEAPRWFELLRDGGSIPKELKGQRKRYKGIFHALKAAGIKRSSSLYEAWNFTVASRIGLTSRLLEIRDDAFAQLGDRNLGDGSVEGSAPRFDVTSVENNPPVSDEDPRPDPRALRIVRGTVEVPCYLVEDGCPPGAGFNYDSLKRDALPTQIPGNVAEAPFACVIPRGAAETPARASLYGHGLLGSANEAINAGNIRDMAVEHNFIFCGTDSWGMSSEDVPYDITALQNLNNFPPVIDRLQQG
ncbi:MAG TPA: hypothetical protein VK920_04125, partial [Solirubrobacterales bacterium]|nr:hypothetical protein [Solirubrobacterales bacterium]